MLKWFPVLTDKISIPGPGLFNIQFAYFTPWSVYKTFINFSNQILNHINIQLHLYKFKIFKFNIKSIFKTSIHNIFSFQISKYIFISSFKIYSISNFKIYFGLLRSTFSVDFNGTRCGSSPNILLKTIQISKRIFYISK